MSDTTVTTPHASTSDLEQKFESTTTVQVQSRESAHPHPVSSPPQPSVRLLFSLVSRRDFYCLLLPAILTSMLAGGVAPFMTYVIGESFDAFANFPTTPNPSQAAKKQLLHGVGIAALELVGLAFGALALSTITSSLWIWTGERNLMAVRKEVYAAVTQKEMVWFDTKMGSEDSVTTTDGDGPVGAGGLMARFARETDEVRMASSLASGFIVQYMTSCITCVVLAFVESWSLTLIILSSVPILMFIQVVSQIFAGAYLNVERSETAKAATLVDRAIAAIATVKAFNAEPHEHAKVGGVLDAMQAAANGCITVWGITATCAQFVTMAMFVQGFWFGSKLVRDGSITPGTVMSVFWACLIAANNLQMCIPQIVVLSKGKFSMAALLALAESEPAAPLGRPGSMALKRSSRRQTHLRKIVPGKCRGEFELDNITFAYPSRPSMPALKDVSIFLPSDETSFIVGSSGSGKSTIAQLLLQMYLPQGGSIRLDDQETAYLDEEWMRSHVAAVSQGCILFDMTVHENVAIGLAFPGSSRRPEDVSRAEVEAVCRAALMHEFVRDLPNGYDTQLGTGGANLSGGQKQRLAIARALLRNPTVLILDEATSALDATSRILVFEAVKRWRQNMTTIVITHDLSQIASDDFVYMLKDGQLVEQGYRSELEACTYGEFRQMVDMQDASGGFPEKPAEELVPVPVEAILEQQLAEMQEEIDTVRIGTKALRHQTITQSTFRPLTMGNWMFDAVADLTNSTTTIPPAVLNARIEQPVSRISPADEEEDEKPIKERRRKTLHIDIPSPPAMVATNHRYSLQFTPTSPTAYSLRSTTTLCSPQALDDDDFDAEKAMLRKNASQVTIKRHGAHSSESLPAKRPRTKWDEKTLEALQAIKVESSENVGSKPEVPTEPPMQSFWSLVRDVYPTLPTKPFIIIGITVCAASGAMTPLFAFLLSRIFVEVSAGAKDVSLINTYGGIVLAVAAADGVFVGLKYAIMEVIGMDWVTRVRKTCMTLVLAQDKKWFDKSENSSARVVQILIKDGDDARALIATVLCQATVVTSMLGVGLIWALIRGWQLTLVGIAIAPVFALSMAVQSNLVAKCETRNKRAREEVAKGYYDAISNVRGIRAMGFESAFQRKFEETTDQALSVGVRGAFIEGCTYGVASALIYLAEALLFYVGAVLIARGTYTYLQMVQVLQLVVFSVSIGSQLMGFTQRIAKSVQATRDFNRLLKLSRYTEESRGVLQPEIDGSVSFSNVSFSYPERSDVPVLKDISLDIADGECVAIVGASGSGKSTIASLLQRLYEPDLGSISIGLNALRSTDVHHLREHVAVVSQHANLFDTTITENIAYGSKSISDADVRRAAQAANVHEFVESLPKGYDTHVGENASLISGGQAQRLQIARALARPARILILDECTSALDAANEAAVMETLVRARVGRTTLVVTHKLQMMRMCDRILVVHDGVIAEEGTYEELMQKHGVFAQLASGGEWTR
ncbi:P-loop containing nucleoside triphosphate hydrolase protein [Laetiporus sulphureus 93-53]|uniref:p-loop containing nucleoside triphosphate hydrolase protein n=1 Tax=Laetiporus sulphureus 93-53 TaxID=1314785 RepID=A0A165BBV1_9APHY|nr:P-loop containing nucleoside triphosphate hydrolase protein [Laetiporus sulphureus 93-53]KZT00697.1 P-loop containing nucleoside triphosphate hydrolase protein [Laetiporus sulphureus 93-53]